VKQLKALFVNDFPSNTGIGNYAFSLFKELQVLTNVEMFYLNSNNDFKEKIEGIKIVNPLMRFPVLNKNLNNLFFFPKKIPKNFDLIHVSNQGLSKISEKFHPSIVSCMDLIPLILSKEYNFFWSWLQKKLIKKLVKANAIITISEHSKKEIIRFLEIEDEKVNVTLLGFNEKIFKPRDKKTARKKLGLNFEEKIVLNVGSEEPRKNIEFLLKVFNRLVKENKNFRLVRIGRQEKTSKKIIKKFGIEKNVSYFYPVSIEKLGLFYNAADLFFFPSKYEGFGLPVLEAMASGCPVIASNKTSIPEVGGNAIKYFTVFDEEQVKELIQKTLENRLLTTKLSRKGIERAKKFSWKKCAIETLKVYEKVLLKG
jgi:glycosyltransferase involved in cell wall biosynthesis